MVIECVICWAFLCRETVENKNKSECVWIKEKNYSPQEINYQCCKDEVIDSSSFFMYTYKFVPLFSLSMWSNWTQDSPHLYIHALHVYIISCTLDHLPVPMTIHTIRPNHVNNVIEWKCKELQKFKIKNSIVKKTI